jgi:hypothetical protein
MTRMGYTGRAPAPDGSQSAWELVRAACYASKPQEAVRKNIPKISSTISSSPAPEAS